MNSKKTYYIQFFSVCVGVVLLSYGLSQFANPYFATTHFWIPTLFFAVTTLVINSLLTKGDKQSKEFVFKTLAMSMARLLICMITVFVYSLINKAHALAFTCHFMVQYVIFNVFEMTFLLKYIKQTG